MSADAEDETIAAVNWRGEVVDCQRCGHRALIDAGRCRRAHACMHDRYARRIDRFFRWNPGLAKEALAHPYFEVRAIAARHADLCLLPPLMADCDETVRMQVALRLPAPQLIRMIADPHREVRIRVAHRLDPTAVVAMRADPDYAVRQIVARRMPLALLPSLIRDPEPLVRHEVALRATGATLLHMAGDAAGEIRRVVAQRLAVERLNLLADDADWLVRWEVAQRAEGATLARMAFDEEADVREAARARQLGLAAASGAPHRPSAGACGD